MLAKYEELSQNAVNVNVNIDTIERKALYHHIGTLGMNLNAAPVHIVTEIYPHPQAITQTTITNHSEESQQLQQHQQHQQQQQQQQPQQQPQQQTQQLSTSSSSSSPQQIQQGEKTHKCPICDKYFSNSGNLNLHLKIHTGNFYNLQFF